MAQDKVLQELSPLREDETILRYLYEHQLQPSEVDAAHIVFSGDYTRKTFLQDWGPPPRYLLADNTFPDGQRVGLFLHPRFAPDFLHAHDYFEIKYALQGNTSLIIGNEPLVLQEGSFCFISPDLPHETLIFDSSTLLMNMAIRPSAFPDAFPRVFASPNYLASFFDPSEHAPGFLVLDRCGDSFRDLVLSAYTAEAARGQSPFALALSESYVEQIMLQLLVHAPVSVQSQPHAEERISAILHYLKEHLTDATLSGTAKAFFLSPSYLSRYLVRTTGHSFQDLLRSYRLQEAAHLLLSDQLTIDDICARIGYQGRSNFYKIFRDRYGVTPTQYRQSQGRQTQASPSGPAESPVLE